VIDVKAKLSEMGLTLPIAAKPVAAYVPAIRTGNLIFTAGQLPLVEGAMSLTGKIGEKISIDQGKEFARICALNCLAAVQTVADVNTIVNIVRVVGYVNGIPGFTSQPAVINGASELFLQIWGESGKHARSAIGVAELPLDAPVEVELVVEISGS
jgi:enamine deaminase RidA (YjgF/YER057c/UK114 family)